MVSVVWQQITTMSTRTAATNKNELQLLKTQNYIVLMMIKDKKQLWRVLTRARCNRSKLLPKNNKTIGI